MTSFGIIILLAIGGAAFMYVVYIIIESLPGKQQKMDEMRERIKRQRAEEAHRALQRAKLLTQAQFIGDETTALASLKEDYDGPLPEKQDNGSWSSPYPQLLALPIAGINYRTGINKCVGSGKARLVADPKNEFDPNAVKVIHESGTHLGFIPQDRTDDIRDLIPCYALTDIEECEDDLDHTRHYFRGWLYINTEKKE